MDEDEDEKRMRKNYQRPDLVSNSSCLEKQKKEIIFNGQHALTEDKILIYNLRISLLPKEATVANVTDFFQQFGKVLNVRFVKGDHWDVCTGKQECIVYFANPEGAAKAALINRFMNQHIRIEYDGFDQPDGERLIKELNSVTENKNNFNSSNEIKQEALVFTLNDDCLEYICKKLSIIDQINFALTCQRFYDIVIMVSKVEYAKFAELSVYEWSRFRTRVFLQIVGPQIKFLDTFGSEFYHCEWQREFMGLFCTNIERIKVIRCHDPQLLVTLIQKMHLLQELELKFLRLSHNFFRYLKTFKNLKFLNMLATSVTGENIHLLCDLEKLSLRKCTYVTSLHFRNICKNLANLQYLDIRHCVQLQAEDYEHISEHLLQLKTLKLSCTNKNLNCIAQLPKLMQLEVIVHFDNQTIIENLLEDLAKFKANQLEVLMLLGTFSLSLDMVSSVAELRNLNVLRVHCEWADNRTLDIWSQLRHLEDIDLSTQTNIYSITDTAVLQLLENCLELKRLNLTFKVTTGFIRNTLELLHKQRFHYLRTDCVHITGLQCEDCDISELQNFTDVLKVTFRL